jgi:hypothetical protein
MRLVALLLLACACKDKPPLAKLADITGDATLVAGTRRVAVYGGHAWWQSDAGGLPLDLESGHRGQEITDVFLGTDPIAVGGEEHAETIVRIKNIPAALDFAGHPSKIVALDDGREAWLAHVGISDELLFVNGTQFEETPKLMLLGAPAEAASPVSARLCATPKVEDIAVLGNDVYALVTECNDASPIRIVTYPGGHVDRLPSRGELGMTFMKLVVSRDGKLHIAGIRDGHLAIDHLDRGKHARGRSSVAATRVQTAVAADDGAIWTLVLDANNKPQVLRNGTVVTTPGPPKALALDDKVGVVVLADKVLLAERPGARFVIETHR